MPNYHPPDRPWSAYPIGTKAKQDGGAVFVKVGRKMWDLEINGAKFNWPCGCEVVEEVE